MNSGKPSQGDSVRGLARGVLRLSRRLRIEHGEAGGLSGLSLLAAIHASGPVPASLLARREGLQPQSLTRLLAGLESRGLIFRRTDVDDRRRVLIEITPQGRRSLGADMGRLWAWLAEAMDHTLTMEEQETLAHSGALLERLAER